MERRRDGLLRGVVDHVQASLTTSGFRLTDRGTHPEVHWVEYRAREATSLTPARETRIVLSHYMAQRSVAAGIRWYEEPSPRAVAHATQGWEYRAGTGQTGGGEGLAPTVAGWITAAVSRGPAS